MDSPIRVCFAPGGVSMPMTLTRKRLAGLQQVLGGGRPGPADLGHVHHALHPGRERHKRAERHDPGDLAVENISRLQGLQELLSSDLQLLAQERAPGYDDVAALVLETGDQKLVGRPHVDRRVRRRGDVDLARRTEGPVLHDLDMEAPLAGFLDLALHRHLFLVGLAQGLGPAGAGNGPRQADFALTDGGHVKLELIALGNGEVLVGIEKFTPFDHGVDLHAGVNEDGVLADGNDAAFYPVANMHFGGLARAEGFKHCRKVLFDRFIGLIHHDNRLLHYEIIGGLHRPAPCLLISTGGRLQGEIRNDEATA